MKTFKQINKNSKNCNNKNKSSFINVYDFLQPFDDNSPYLDPSYSYRSVTLKYLILYRIKLKKIYYGTEFGTKTRRKKSGAGVKIK